MFSIALVIDMLISVFLWIGQPDKVEIMHSIKHYTITESVFDLACISLGRCILLIPILASLENSAVQRMENGAKRTQEKSTILKFISAVLILGSIVFSIYKGVKVILSYEDNNEKEFKSTDYALCISFTVSSLLFSICLLGYFKHLKRLRCHYAQFGDDIESTSESYECKEKKPKQKVNLKRLIALLKPVSHKI